MATGPSTFVVRVFGLDFIGYTFFLRSLYSEFRVLRSVFSKIQFSVLHRAVGELDFENFETTLRRKNNLNFEYNIMIEERK